MLKKQTSLMLSAAAALVMLSAPVIAEDAYDCDAHAAHIDHEIGAEKALDAYHVLHGDKADDHHIIEELKKEHPGIEHELEEYNSKGCTIEALEAHAHDAETEAKDAH